MWSLYRCGFTDRQGGSSSCFEALMSAGIDDGCSFLPLKLYLLLIWISICTKFFIMPFTMLETDAKEPKIDNDLNVQGRSVDVVFNVLSGGLGDRPFPEIGWIVSLWYTLDFL